MDTNTTMMTQKEIAYIAHFRNICSQQRSGKWYSTEGWTIKFENIKCAKTLGICRYYDKTVIIQKSFIEYGKHEDIMDTIKHEIAHILAGVEARHGLVWKTAAMMLGAHPRAKSKGKLPTECIGSSYRYQLAYVVNGEIIERFSDYRQRKSCLKGKMIKGRRETINQLQWVSL